MLKTSERVFTRQVGFVYVVQLACLALATLEAALIGRWLGPEGKGLLSMCVLVPAVVSLFLNGGVGMANAYFAGSRRLDLSTLASNSIRFGVLMTLVGWGIICVLSVCGWIEIVLPGVPLDLLFLALLILPIQMLTTYLGGILQGIQQIAKIMMVNLSIALLSLVLVALLLVFFHCGVTGALIAHAMAIVAGLALSLVYLQREGIAIVSGWSLNAMSQMLGFGLRGYIGNLLQFLNYRLDMFVVNYFLGSAEVGIYAVSVRCAELLWHLPNAVGFVIFPKAASSKPKAMNAFTPKVFGATVGLTALAGFGLAIVGEPLIILVYSEPFAVAYQPMLALLPGVVLMGGGKVLSNEIAGRGYPHYNSLNSGIALLVTVALDLILIPHYGALGAALASSAAYAVMFVTAIILYLIVSRRAEKQFDLSDLNVVK